MISLKNTLFSTLVFLVCIGLLEIGLSLTYQFPDGYFVATPNTEFIWPKDSLKKGINHDAHVLFDNWGSRSISDPSKKGKAIITIGGSTTACYSLDQKRTWSALLEKKLGEDYWVGNFGKPGNFSDHHLVHLQEIIRYRGLPEIDKVIVMMGKNDISASLTKPQKYLSLSDFDRNINAFKHQPDSVLPWYRRFALTKLYKRSKNNIIHLYRRKTHGEELKDCRRIRQNTKELDRLPDLTEALAHYEENAKKMIQIARSNNIELVFVSQAVLWSKHLSTEDQKLICSYVPDQNIHYSLDALAKGMQLFNERLEALCQQENIPFIWNNIASNSDHFFDDCHYTEKGALVVADEIYKGLYAIDQEKKLLNR